MEEQPGRLEKSVIPLGALLLLAGLSGSAFVVQPALSSLVLENRPMRTFRLIFSVLMALTGIVALQAGRRPLSPGWKGFAVVLMIATLAMTEVYPWSGAFLDLARSSSFLWAFGVLGNVLIGAGAPLLWGAALVRRDLPQNDLLQRLGRYSAGLIQLGLVVGFVGEVQFLEHGILRRGFEPGNIAETLEMLYPVVRLAARAALLWASIQSVRAAADPDLVRERAAQILKLMTAWIVLLGALGLTQALAAFVDPGTLNRQSLWTSGLWLHGCWIVVPLASTALLATILRGSRPAAPG